MEREDSPVKHREAVQMKVLALAPIAPPDQGSG